ncbi:unnamed protein product [Mytilus edulis]|uniref:Fibronectin type-III domain-containing protein n=1 Tax=Mytilus edulis TaxID=6550 RepID=A0A8S3S3X9_MYTED|nr:unnamed protein product [Mytilus edulis]
MEVQGITSSSISLSWKRREGAYTYSVKYREVDRGVQETFKVKNTLENQIILRNLKCNTLYEIKVYIEDTNGDESYLDKIEQETRESFAIQLTEKANKIIDEVISVYQLCVKGRQLGANKNIKVYEYFSEIYNSEERTLLVVGASGSGKSTMINAIVNFVADVSFTERFRFKIAEEKCQTRSSKGANRANVTCYRIRHHEGFRIGYNLNMIEVPELDDLSLKNGNYLYVIQQLIDLLGSGEIKFIHAACLVVPSFSRLTNEQKCIFENIVSIFEKTSIISFL